MELILMLDENNRSFGKTHHTFSLIIQLLLEVVSLYYLYVYSQYQWLQQQRVLV